MTEQINGKTEENPASTDPGASKNPTNPQDTGTSTPGPAEGEASPSSTDGPVLPEDSGRIDDPNATLNSSASVGLTTEQLLEQIQNLERITRRQAEVLGTALKGLRDHEARTAELQTALEQAKADSQPDPLAAKEIEEVREEYGRVSRQVHLLQRQVDLLKEHLDDHFSGRKPVDRWQHTIHQNNQKFGGAAAGVPGKSGWFKRFLWRLFFLILLVCLSWYFFGDTVRKLSEVNSFQELMGLFSQQTPANEVPVNNNPIVEQLPVKQPGCPGGRDYADEMASPNQVFDLEWLNHFQVVRSPQALLYALEIEERQFRQELIMLGRAIADNKALLVDANNGRQWIRLDQPINGHQSFMLETLSASRPRSYRKVNSWLDDYLASGDLKAPADNLYYIWLQIFCDHSEKDGFWSNGLQRSLERYLAANLPDLAGSREVDRFLDVLSSGTGNPLKPAVQGPIKALFDMASGDFTLQILALGENLRSARKDLEDSWYPLNRTIQEREFEIDVVFCFNNQPTALELWFRNGAEPDQAVLMLWLAANLGLKSSDGSTEAVVNKLTFLKHNQLMDVARTCKL